MIEISYFTLIAVITLLWIAVRVCVWIGKCRICCARELKLLLVYVCIVVVARFTCFPFGTLNGEIQPLVFDPARMLPPNMNLVPLVCLFDYPHPGDALLNIIGNTAMFLPLGIVWPSVYPTLCSHARVIVAGIGFSLFIELFQLPFYSRVSDVDDLILNSIGYLIGYGIYLLSKQLRGRNHKEENT